MITYMLFQTKFGEEIPWHIAGTCMDGQHASLDDCSTCLCSEIHPHIVHIQTDKQPLLVF